MGLGKLLKKLIPIAKTVGSIPVSSGTGGAILGTALRQVILVGSGYLATKGVISGDDVQTTAASVLAIGTAIYGQLKAHKDKAEKIAAADPTQPASLELVK